MNDNDSIEPGKILCPKCKQMVDRVDGEYGLHYVVANLTCTMSKRELREEVQDDNGA